MGPGAERGLGLWEAALWRMYVAGAAGQEETGAVAGGRLTRGGKWEIMLRWSLSEEGCLARTIRDAYVSAWSEDAAVDGGGGRCGGSQFGGYGG